MGHCSNLPLSQDATEGCGTSLYIHPSATVRLARTKILRDEAFSTKRPHCHLQGPVLGETTTTWGRYTCFAEALQKLAKMAWPLLHPLAREEMITEQFLNSLRNYELRVQAATKGAGQINDLMRLKQSLEAVEGE